MSATAAGTDLAASLLASAPLWHGYPGSDLTGFPGVGTWLIFTVILMPVWVMILSWFVGWPNDTKTGLMGVAYLAGIVAAMWGGMLVLTLLLGVLFYGGLPSPF